MISQQGKKSRCEHSSLLKIAWAVLATSSVMLAQPVLAGEYSLSGDSNTYLRMKKTVSKDDVYPLYEYLRFSVSVAEKDGSATALHVGAWGRVDLGDKSTDDRVDKDLQYGYLSYQGSKNNLVLNAGRQFVTEGVAAERLDGLYARTDLAAGFTAAAFLGSPVETEPYKALQGGQTIYGGRVSQGKPGLYTVGVSGLRSEGEQSSRNRGEEGVDFWIHPVKQVDLTGRSSYNSETSGWMEHAYTVSVAPIDKLNVSAELTQVNYRDYFYNVTTTAFSLIGAGGLLDPNEEMTAAGLSASYALMKDVTVGADYKNYSYKIAGDADYYGANATFALPGSVSAGCSLHRMDGDSDRLRYTELRLYGLKKMGAVDVVGDLFNVHYDRSVNGTRNSFALTGSAGYRFDEKLRVSADVEYSQNPDFDNELRGLVKVAYAFDTKRSEGGGKSEK